MNASPPTPDPIAEALSLINALLDDRLDAAGARRLESLVVERPDVRRLYVLYLHQECVIVPHAGVGAMESLEHDLVRARDREALAGTDAMTLPAIRAAEPFGEPVYAAPREPAPRPLPHNWRPWIGGLAAAIVLAVGVWAGVFRQGSGQRIATLHERPDTLWEGVQPIANGASVGAGTAFHLKHGVVEFAFDSGARIVVQAPARFTADSSGQLTLTTGRLFATVPPRAVGFSVRTPAGTIVDLGTEFGVDRRPDGTTEIDVFTGRVRAEPAAGTPAAARAPQILNAGQASRLEDLTRVWAARPQQYQRTLVDPPLTPPPATIAATVPVTTEPSVLTKVDLSRHFDSVGITVDGQPTPDRGIDGNGNAYSRSQLVPLDKQFDLGPTGARNVITARGQDIPLPPGVYQSLAVLGSAINGKKSNLAFTVVYADGTRQRCMQSLSNWYTPSNFENEAVALAMPSRNTADGTAKNSRTYIYRYELRLDAAKPVRSVILPDDTQSVVILAINAVP